MDSMQGSSPKEVDKRVANSRAEKEKEKDDVCLRGYKKRFEERDVNNGESRRCKLALGGVW